MDPDADPDLAIFVIVLQDANKKLNFLRQFFCLLLFEGTFTSFLKDKFLLGDRKIRIRIQEAPKRTGPQHCLRSGSGSDQPVFVIDLGSWIRS
jgi:hypothetical protein